MLVVIKPIFGHIKYCVIIVLNGFLNKTCFLNFLSSLAFARDHSSVG